MTLPVPILRESRPLPPTVRPAIATPAGLSVVERGPARVDDVSAYLKTRVPCADPDSEMPLFVTLGADVQARVRKLLYAFSLIETHRSVREWAMMVSRGQLGRQEGWSAERLRKLFERYQENHDWVDLVDKAKAGLAWQEGGRRGLPEEFLRFVSQTFASFRRADGGNAAVKAIHNQWRTGRDYRGRPAPIPGYGFWQDWFAREFPGVPLPPCAPAMKGWSADNLRKKAGLGRAVKALCHESVSAARTYTPGILGTRVNLRFLEMIEYDDVKTDFRVFDPETRQVMDLWLLIARDLATNLLLGFGMRPARVRDDGSQEHLRLRDMKQLFGGVLERYGIPVEYTSTHRVENGTATVPRAVQAALPVHFGDRLRVSYTGMIGGKSPAGYLEKAKGNSRGKGSLESTNRPLHTAASNLPGQTGRKYELRPAELAAREKETTETLKLGDQLPPHLRGKMGYSLLTLEEARANLLRIFDEQNRRDDHDLEGFETVLEWRPNISSAWQSRDTAPDPLPETAEIRPRKESPTERATRLCQGCKFERVSPVALRTFFENTERLVRVNDCGEIEFTSEKRSLVFADPNGPGPSGGPLAPGTECLAFFHLEDPAFLHLVAIKGGAYLGTWIQRARVKHGDREAIAEAARYTQAALKAQKEEAARLLAPEREEREERLASNAALVSQHEFIDVAPIPESQGSGRAGRGAAALAAVGAHRTRVKDTQSEADLAEAQRAAADILAPTHTVNPWEVEDPEPISQEGATWLTSLGQPNHNHED